MNQPVQSRILAVPRGTPGQPNLELELGLLDLAEKRLYEVRLNNPAMAKDLEGLFNEAANTASKYLAWLEYEILQAKKNNDLNRATVIIDKLPAEAAKLKESGMKMNEDYREAFIMRDEACVRSRDVLDSLTAVQALIKASFDTFVRAHYSARNKAAESGQTPVPNFSGTTVGGNFMGNNGRQS